MFQIQQENKIANSSYAQLSRKIVLIQFITMKRQALLFIRNAASCIDAIAQNCFDSKGMI